MRIALPGVQFLFAFLLVAPFQQTREDLTGFRRTVYVVALPAATSPPACSSPLPPSTACCSVPSGGGRTASRTTRTGAGG